MTTPDLTGPIGEYAEWLTLLFSSRAVREDESGPNARMSMLRMRLVAVAIADTGTAGRGCALRMADLAADLGCSERVLARSRSALLAAGWLRLVPSDVAAHAYAITCPEWALDLAEPEADAA